MAITPESMWTKIKTHMDAVATVQSANPADALAQREEMGLAMCRGICEEIKQNAVVTTNDAQGGSNSGTVA